LIKLISKEYANERRKLINENRAARTYDAGELEQGNTIYMTVADKEGNMVSLIQSKLSWNGFRDGTSGSGFYVARQGRAFFIGKRPCECN
jgi:gamma-glutamyltranspeptidase/glutathione hydrolase